MAVPSASERVIAAGRDLGVEVAVREFPEGTKTAVDAAAAVGCAVQAIVKSLVFMVDDEPVIALVPGDRRLDAVKLAEVAGGSNSRRAGLEEVRSATGYAAGGTPPFGYPSPLRVWADVGLRRDRELWAAAGTPTTVFPIEREDLIRASGATWADVSE